MTLCSVCRSGFHDVCKNKYFLGRKKEKAHLEDLKSLQKEVKLLQASQQLLAGGSGAPAITYKPTVQQPGTGTPGVGVIGGHLRSRAKVKIQSDSDSD